jgi:hypothetical protein
MVCEDFLLAGLRFRLGDVDAPTRRYFDSTMAELAVVAEGDADVLLAAERVSESPCPEAAGRAVQVSRHVGDAVIFARRWDFLGSWTEELREARCRYLGKPDSLLAFLRIVCSFALIERSGVLFHASSVVSGGRAFAFAGPSGAGKTTLSRLAAPRPVLSDEVTAVVMTPDGDFTCHPTPFWGDLTRERLGPPAPLALFGFPGRASTASLRPVRPAEAFSRLLESTIAFDLVRREKLLVLDVVGALARVVPCAHVVFALNDSPWEILDAYAPPG